MPYLTSLLKVGEWAKSRDKFEDLQNNNIIQLGRSCGSHLPQIHLNTMWKGQVGENREQWK